MRSESTFTSDGDLCGCVIERPVGRTRQTHSRPRYVNHTHSHSPTHLCLTAYSTAHAHSQLMSHSASMLAYMLHEG